MLFESYPQIRKSGYGLGSPVFVHTLRQELGVVRFHVFPNFESHGFEGRGFGIQHVDCLLKLLDEERMLVRRVPKDHPDFEHVEAVVRQLAKLTSVYRWP
jgi:hypothetical protein